MSVVFLFAALLVGLLVGFVAGRYVGAPAGRHNGHLSRIELRPGRGGRR